MLFEISCAQDFQILFSKGHNSEKGHNSDVKKMRVNLFFFFFFFFQNESVKFKNLSIHSSKVSNFTQKWNCQSKFQNSVILSKIDGSSLKLVR